MMLLARANGTLQRDPAILYSIFYHTEDLYRDTLLKVMNSGGFGWLLIDKWIIEMDGYRLYAPFAIYMQVHCDTEV